MCSAVDKTGPKGISAAANRANQSALDALPVRCDTIEEVLVPTGKIVRCRVTDHL
jgi:hypothetical protein